MQASQTEDELATLPAIATPLNAESNATRPIGASAAAAQPSYTEELPPYYEPPSYTESGQDGDPTSRHGIWSRKLYALWDLSRQYHTNLVGWAAIVGGIVLAALALVPAFVSQAVTEKQYELDKWQALKEFFDYCQEKKGEGHAPANCKDTLDAEMPSPPGLDLGKAYDRLTPRFPRQFRNEMRHEDIHSTSIHPYAIMGAFGISLTLWAFGLYTLNKSRRKLIKRHMNLHPTVHEHRLIPPSSTLKSQAALMQQMKQVYPWDPSHMGGETRRLLPEAKRLLVEAKRLLVEIEMEKQARDRLTAPHAESQSIEPRGNPFSSWVRPVSPGQVTVSVDSEEHSHAHKAVETHMDLPKEGRPVQETAFASDLRSSDEAEAMPLTSNGGIGADFDRSVHGDDASRPTANDESGNVSISHGHMILPPEGQVDLDISVDLDVASTGIAAPDTRTGPLRLDLFGPNPNHKPPNEVSSDAYYRRRMDDRRKRQYDSGWSDPLFNVGHMKRLRPDDETVGFSSQYQNPARSDEEARRQRRRMRRRL